MYRPRIRRSKILDECPPSDAQFRCRQCTVKILGAEQMPVHPLHQPIKHIARSVCIGMIIGRLIISDILT
jgi:hypothetical protein